MTWESAAKFAIEEICFKMSRTVCKENHVSGDACAAFISRKNKVV